MRIIFFGTPKIASIFLKELLKTEEVVGVVTRPDKPVGRGQHIAFPPVKMLSEEAKIPVFQPEKFTSDVIKSLSSLNADVGVVISYGKLIPKSVFTLPVMGCFNVHFSLLPKYRGAAPIQRALINGEKETGVDTFWLEEALDSGPIIVSKRAAITPQDDAITLEEKLIVLGIDVLRETIAKIASQNCAGIPQAGAPSFAPSLKKEDGRIDWKLPAHIIADLIRGTRKWPGAWSVFESGHQSGKVIKILKARALEDCTISILKKNEPGGICGLIKNDSFVVSCGTGFLAVEEVVVENKKPMPAWAFWQGSRLQPGDKFGIMQRLRTKGRT